MNLRPELSPIDGTVHSDNLALLTACLNSSTYEQLQLAEPLFFPDNNSYILLIAGDKFTRTTIVYQQLGNEILIVVNGINGTQQIQAVLDSWVSTTGPDQTGNIYAQAALYIISQLPANPSGGWNRITLIGHSFGGAVCHWLTTLLVGNLQSHPEGIFCYTYGAPKETVTGGGFSQTNTYYRRVISLADPVPSLPPGPTNMGSVWTVTGIPTARDWATWRHAYQSYIVGSDGIMQTHAGDPFIANVGFILSLASWISGSTAFGSESHSLAFYTSRLATVIPAPRPTLIPATTRETTRVPSLTANEMNIVREQAIVNVANAVQAAPGDTALGILTGIPRVAGARFTGGRFNGQPYVFYNGQPLVPSKTLRTRRALVRYLNRQMPR